MFGNLQSAFGWYGSGGGGSAINGRVTVLEDNESKEIYYEEISANSGQVTVPAQASIILGQFPSGINALVSTIVNGYPSMEIPTQADGTPIVVTSFDAAGNYVLSGTPSAFPIAILYLLKIEAKYYSNLDIDFIIPGYDEVGTDVPDTVLVSSNLFNYYNIQ